MGKPSIGVSGILDQLESFYGKQEPCWPVDPYLFLVWWHCGYPASDAACSKGWESLIKEVGTALPEILAAPDPETGDDGVIVRKNDPRQPVTPVACWHLAADADLGTA